jgi:hypothetical protein
MTEERGRGWGCISVVKSAYQAYARPWVSSPTPKKQSKTRGKRNEDARRRETLSSYCVPDASCRTKITLLQK